MADQATGILSPWLRKKRINIAKPFINGNVLDFGCGVGTMAEFCDPEYYLGIDVDEESLRIAKMNYPKFRFASDLPVNERFDAVVLLAVIEHFADPLGVLGTLRKILRPNGKIVITTPKVTSKYIHHFGAALGLFSSSAKEEHEDLFDRRRMQILSEQVGLRLSHYRTFLFCLNQLFILEDVQ